MVDAVGQYMQEVGRRAHAAARAMARAGAAAKDHALLAVTEALQHRRERLTAANAEDLAEARRKELPAALLDRLALDEARIASMTGGLRQVAALPDPVGEIADLRPRPSGIRVGTMRVPLGVIGIIYESRPSVTADAAGLCIKSGNAVILRGGSEARRSNREIGECVREGLRAASLPEDAVIVVDTDDRAAVGELLRMQQFVDVVIPRGGRGLIERVSREARMPVIKHLDGICHVYVDDKADLDKAEAIAYNAKTQRYGTCNTMECLLVADAVAPELLARLGPRFAAAGVEIRGCDASRRLLPEIRAATPEDYGTEYLAPILSLRIVDGLPGAVEHIERYGSRHTDAIVTEDLGRAMRFLREVDSSSVLVNASTRFADGYEYGLGAEIGISTDKFHARGPVGLEGLTSCKYVVLGDGQIRN